jgi:predicted DNA-binding transcriptional regulator YafY
MRLAGASGFVSAGMLAARCRVSPEVARRELVALRRAGLLLLVGAGRGAHYRIRDGHGDDSRPQPLSSER